MIKILLIATVVLLCLFILVVGGWITPINFRDEGKPEDEITAGDIYTAMKVIEKRKLEEEGK